MSFSARSVNTFGSLARKNPVNVLIVKDRLNIVMPKVFDCFCWNGEQDILEIRLNILDPFVDYFIICESEQTFSGKPKPIYYKGDNPQVIHIIAPNIETDNAFERAKHQKDYIRTALKDCDPEDIIYYGDVDEIWKPQTEEGKLHQLNYSYYLNNRSSEEWYGTNVFKYKNIRPLHEIRADHSKYLENGGWHFQNLGGADQIRKKLESYDHQEFNNEDLKADLERKMDVGEDYVGRQFDWQGNSFSFWIDESELPSYIIDNKEKWKKLLR